MDSKPVHGTVAPAGFVLGYMVSFKKLFGFGGDDDKPSPPPAPVKITPPQSLYDNPPQGAVADWISYFDSERGLLLALEHGYNTSDLARLAFESISGRQIEFFNLKPSPGDIVRALELPLGYDAFLMKQSKYPAAWVKNIATLALANTNSLADWRTIASFMVPSNLEWEELKRDVLGRAMISGIEIRVPNSGKDLIPHRFQRLI